MIVAVIGNALEWYDFVVFGFLTAIISRLFFPTDSEYASLLLTTAAFGVGFFMRPVGAIVLGVFADKIRSQGGDATHHIDRHVYTVRARH